MEEIEEIKEQREIKVAMVTHGIKYRDVAAMAKISPDRFYGILGGFKRMKSEEKELIDAAIQHFKEKAEEEDALSV